MAHLPSTGQNLCAEVLADPPRDYAGNLDALDRGLRTAERPEDGLLDQRAATFIRCRDGLHAHDLFGERARRHGLRRLAQHVGDQSQAFARMEPGTTGPLWPNPSLFRREVWIEQPHGGVEMHEIGTMVDDLLLQMAHGPAQLGSLQAQSVYDVRLSHRHSPSRNIKL